MEGLGGASPGAIVLVIVSLIVTFGVVQFIYPEHFASNIGLHVLLGLYYFAAVGNPDLVLGTHLVNFAALGIFILVISNNLRFTELFSGKLKYSLENNSMKVINDMINRKLYKEEKGQIIDIKGRNWGKMDDRFKEQLSKHKDPVFIAKKLVKEFLNKGFNKFYVIPPIRIGGIRDYGMATELIKSFL